MNKTKKTGTKLTFWQKLKRPFTVLAPMSNLTDAAQRKITAKYGKPDITFTEFVAVNGLCSPKGRARLLPDLKYSEAERPVVAQLFGKDPENFYKSSQLVRELGFDGVDINCGCPDKMIMRQGAGADLMNNPELVREIIEATRSGSQGLPVSVKTRIGYLENSVETWIPEILKAKPATISLHGRTRKQMYRGFADWQAIKRAAEIAHEQNTLLIGNGDITSLQQGFELAAESKVDGIMIGRAIIGNPWIFNPDVNKENLSLNEVLEVMLEHCRVYEDTFDEDKKFFVMRNHMSHYVKGFEGSKLLRSHLVQTNNSKEVEFAIKAFQTTLF